MAKYPRQKKPKTIDRGLKPSPQFPDGFPQEKVKKMAEIIEKILTNGQLDERAGWIITQARLAVSFRRATTNEARNEAMQQMKPHREKGHQLGFSETDIKAINRVVLQKDQDGQLEDFSLRLAKIERREN